MVNRLSKSLGRSVCHHMAAPNVHCHIVARIFDIEIVVSLA